VYGFYGLKGESRRQFHEQYYSMKHSVAENGTMKIEHHYCRGDRDIFHAIARPFCYQGGATKQP